MEHFCEWFDLAFILRPKASIGRWLQREGNTPYHCGIGTRSQQRSRTLSKESIVVSKSGERGRESWPGGVPRLPTAHQLLRRVRYLCTCTYVREVGCCRYTWDKNSPLQVQQHIFQLNGEKGRDWDWKFHVGSIRGHVNVVVHSLNPLN